MLQYVLLRLYISFKNNIIRWIMDCLYNDSAPAHVGICTCNQNLCNYFSIYILYVYVFACTM